MITRWVLVRVCGKKVFIQSDSAISNQNLVCLLHFHSIFSRAMSRQPAIPFRKRGASNSIAQQITGKCKSRSRLLVRLEKKCHPPIHPSHAPCHAMPLLSCHRLFLFSLYLAPFRSYSCSWNSFSVIWWIDESVSHVWLFVCVTQSNLRGDA